MIHAGGRDWVTANEVPDLWPDVQAPTVRAWAARGKLNGHQIGREVYYDLNELTEVEYRVRNSGRGNRRNAAPTSMDALQS